LQGNEQVYVTDRKESGYTMEIVLHSTQYREMYKAIGREIRGIGGKRRWIIMIIKMKTNKMIKIM